MWETKRESNLRSGRRCLSCVYALLQHARRRKRWKLCDFRLKQLSCLKIIDTGRCLQERGRREEKGLAFKYFEVTSNGEACKFLLWKGHFNIVRAHVYVYVMIPKEKCDVSYNYSERQEKNQI
ncbi:uncharacterized protein LOC129308822 [Prosopis cineraria]|uniref:uncharacterized protein LOC129308822 n=1 Tax=Prosopis cineraria TaxID=364024 RepID=UPI00240F45D7|nr:uncharacterized protein LOC129308822 [Prosopis cineraria]